MSGTALGWSWGVTALAVSLAVACERRTAPTGAAPASSDGWRMQAGWVAKLEGLDETGSSPKVADRGFTWENATFRLTRTGCYGTCPAYELSVYPDGRVEYVGTAFVGACGRRVGQVARAGHARLARAFREANYLDSDLLLPSDAVEVTDMDTAVTLVEQGSKGRAISHYASEISGPRLRSLEHLVDEVAGVSKWAKCEVKECSCTGQFGTP